MEGEEGSPPKVSRPILIQRLGFTVLGIGLGWMLAARIYIEDAFGENNPTLVNSVLIGAGFISVGIVIALISLGYGNEKT